MSKWFRRRMMLVLAIGILGGVVGAKPEAGGEGGSIEVALER